MEYACLKRTGMKVSKIAFGSWAAGKGAEWGKSLEDKVYIDAIQSSIEGGIDLIDTAAGYGQGNSEEIVRSALKGINKKVYIATKNNASSLKKGKGSDTVSESMKRLGRDYIDIFFLHWPDPDIPIEENVEELCRLKEKGLIGAVGLSNVTLDHLRRAVSIGNIDVIQPCYSLFWRHIENDILPFCINNGIGVMAYSTLAQGLLSGKFKKGWKFEETDQRPRKIPFFQEEIFEDAVKAVEKMKITAADYEKTVAQAALNWTIHQPGITSAIVGAKTSKQAVENIGAVDWKMSKEDMEIIGNLGMSIAQRLMDWDTLFAKEDPRIRT
jgi:myo-inositol catabolism protein IolS